MKEKVLVENINMNYHSIKCETEALKGINFTVNEGEFVTIVGPSGCGKSTILSIIAGLIPPSSGEILLDGEKLTTTSTKIGYMFQTDQLFEWLNVWDNISIGLKIQHKLTEENIKLLNDLLVKYNLWDFKSHRPDELSGGMRQRVALIRTLALQPELLLLDEPFSALDYQTRLKVGDEIAGIIRKEGKTAIMVTHDISEGISMSDRVIVFSKRPAVIKCDIHIIFPPGCSTPLKRRESPEFRFYFNKIWKELDLND